MALSWTSVTTIFVQILPIPKIVNLDGKKIGHMSNVQDLLSHIESVFRCILQHKLLSKYNNFHHRKNVFLEKYIEEIFSCSS